MGSQGRDFSTWSKGTPFLGSGAGAMPVWNVGAPHIFAGSEGIPLTDLIHFAEAWLLIEQVADLLDANEVYLLLDFSPLDLIAVDEALLLIDATMTAAPPAVRVQQPARATVEWEKP